MKHSKNEVKRFLSNKSVIWILLFCLAIFFSFRYCEKKGKASSQEAACPLFTDTTKNIRFDYGVNCIVVKLPEGDASSGWIITPAGSTYRYANKGEESKISEVEFWDGTSYSFNSRDEFRWAGIKRGVFRLKGKGYAIVFVER